jgi:hypothetical protein|tara:strand:+ start:68094 stop:68357 length:264 start_codon:yes stop_codon:yes gene_type:complete
MDLREKERIRALLNAAAHGPWIASVEGRDHLAGSNIIMTRTADGSPGEDFDIVGATAADLDFIASARQDVEKLLHEVERLQRIVDAK